MLINLCEFTSDQAFTLNYVYTYTYISPLRMCWALLEQLKIFTLLLLCIWIVLSNEVIISSSF